MENAPMNTGKNLEKKVKKVPHVYVILLGIVLICAALTYIVPSGQYLRVEGPDGRMVVDPNSFQLIANTPVNLWGVLKSVPQGMVESAEIIFFIFIVGGAFNVINATGAIDAGIGKLTKTMSGREKLVIPIVMIAFSLGGAVFGMAEETIPFIPVMVTLAIALGFDSLTGAGMVLIGAGAGFAGSFMNPFTVGVAQGIAELPLFSGFGYRIICYLFYLTLAIGFMLWYASKVKKNPEFSPMYEFDRKREERLDFNNLKEFTGTHKIVLLIVFISIFLLIFGVVKYGWYITEIAALFLGMAIVVGLVGNLGLNGFAESLVEGMASLAGGALVVGFAKAILIVLNQGNILDPMLNSISGAVATLPSTLAALGMYIFQCLLNFAIPSGSGQAAVTMPIMAPLSDLVNVTRQTAVLAFQFGDGISNIFTPTSGYFMAGLALAKIPWNKWAKWIFKYILMAYGVGAVLIIIAQLINLGPF